MKKRILEVLFMLVVILLFVSIVFAYFYFVVTTAMWDAKTLIITIPLTLLGIAIVLSKFLED